MQRAAITRVQDAVTTYWKKQDNDIHNTVDRVVGECRGQSLEMGSALEAKMVRKRGIREEKKKGRGEETEEGREEEKERCALLSLTLVCTCKRVYHRYFTCLFLLLRSSFFLFLYGFLLFYTLFYTLHLLTVLRNLFLYIKTHIPSPYT